MATLMHADGTETVLTLTDTPPHWLRQLQEAVSGYIEVVARGSDGRTLIMNEEGSFREDRVVNQRAITVTAELYGVPVDEIIPLYGPAVVLTADETRAWEAHDAD